MPHPLTGSLRGALAFSYVAVNTVFWCIPLFAVALLKLLIPVAPWRKGCGKLLNGFARQWVGWNSLGLDLTKSIHWDVQGIDGLRSNGSYLLMANHQSMVDIVVLQKIFHRRTPLLKFFIKRELMWVPLLGLAWWALDFPFMKRTGSTERDLETARRACEKFLFHPVTVMNFVEGTRFTELKREQRGSPYRRLLKPKAGGIAVVLSQMGRRLESILDVTIAYPGGAPGLWRFLCAKSMEIRVRVRQLPVPDDLLGNGLDDAEARRRVSEWLNARWREKDAELEALQAPQSPPV